MSQERDGQSSDQGVWRVNHRSRYWESDVWIIPIHQPAAHHWELAVVYVKERQIALFDSFANASTWEKDVQVGRSCALLLRSADVAYFGLDRIFASAPTSPHRRGAE